MKDYQLIDFGNGRKWERVLDRIIERPSPAAESASPARNDPPKADSVFSSSRRRWLHHRPWTEPSRVECGGFAMAVAPTPFGHLGLFAEQSANWSWLSEGRTGIPDDGGTGPTQQSVPEGLNLFAYTGASTMAMVAAGMRVTHVDAAKPNVAAAGENARLNGWPEPPIRFIVDDAMKFTARELRRQRRYATIVLDPPGYGHGPGGATWRLERDLWPLLRNCLRLLSPHRFRLLVTAHSSEINQVDVSDFLTAEFRSFGQQKQPAIAKGRLGLVDESGRTLDAGFYVRCSV